MAVVPALGIALPCEPTARLTIAASPRMALLIPLDPTLAGVRIDRVPDRLARLRRLGKHVPIVADALQRRTCCPMETHFVLARTAVPDRDRALPATFKIAPEAPLIASRLPAIGQDDVHDTKPQQTPRRSDRSSGASEASRSAATIPRAVRSNDPTYRPPLRRWLDHATRHNAGQYFPAMRVSKRHTFLPAR